MRPKADGIASLVKELRKAGPGSRAIVTGWGEPPVGHAFNAYLGKDGVVKFVDGQTGSLVDLGPWKSIRYIRTN